MKRTSALLLTLIAISPHTPLLALKTMKTTEATPAATNDLTFEKAVFVPDATTPRLYLSHAGNLADALDKPYQITRAELTTDDAGKAAVKMVGITPADASVNGGAAAPNELITGEGSQLIAAVGSSGLAVVPSADGGTDLNKHLYLITDAAKEGATQLKTDNAGHAGVLDKNGAPTANIVAIAAAPNAIAAGDDLYFAANSIVATAWDGAAGNDGRSIAILGKSGDGKALTQRDIAAVQTSVDAGAAANPGVIVNFQAIADDQAARNQRIMITENGVGNDVAGAEANSAALDLFWDGNFNRLYMGLDVRGSQFDNGKQGALIGVHTIRIDPAGTAAAENIYNDFNVGMITHANKRFAVGGYNTDADNNGAKDLVVTARKVRTMKTSTNKDYLIVASSVSVDGGGTAGEGLCALPLVAGDGRLAKVTAGVATNFTDFIDVAANAPQATDRAVDISQNVPFTLDKFADLSVQGDSVYFALNDPTADSPTKRGVFRSTALFNDVGAIVGWTPCERIGGDLGAVNAAGYDVFAGNLYALTSQGDGLADLGKSPLNTVKITAWENNTDAASFDKNVAGNFTSVTGGVHNVFAFDEATPGFKDFGGGHPGAGAQANYNNSGLNLMVAVGKDNASLIQVGVGDAANKFIQTDDFSVGDGVVNRTDDALKTIAPLSCCEVSRHEYAAADPEQGYFFVGGVKGLAVFSTDANGDGFVGRNHGAADALAALNSAAGNHFPGDGFTFKVLTPTTAGNSFSNTRKIACLDTRTYVMTNNAIYFFENAAAKFTAAGPADLDEVKLDFTGTALAGKIFTDLVVLPGRNGEPAAGNHTLLIGTTTGLYVAETENGAGLVAGSVSAQADADTRPVAQLKLLSMTKGRPSPQGNLFVLYGDLAAVPATGVVKRYFVDAAAAVADKAKLISNDVAITNEEIPGVNTFDLGEFRSNIFTDGNSIFTTRGKHFGRTDLVNGTVIRSSLNTDDAMVMSSAAADLLQEGGFAQVGCPVTNPATGSVVIPGEWGIVANQ